MVRNQYIASYRLKSVGCNGLWLISTLFLSGLFSDTSLAASPNSVLRIELASAKCRLDPSLQKQRQCLEGYNLVVKGLYPEVAYRCGTNSSSKLAPLQARAVARIMPNEAQRRHLWNEVGGCFAGNASQYFRQITQYAERFKVPKILIGHQSYTISHQQMRQLISSYNSANALPYDAFRLQCQYSPKQKRHLLTEIRICYDENGGYRSCAVSEVSTCPSSFVIQGSY